MKRQPSLSFSLCHASGNADGLTASLLRPSRHWSPSAKYWFHSTFCIKNTFIKELNPDSQWKAHPLLCRVLRSTARSTQSVLGGWSSCNLPLTPTSSHLNGSCPKHAERHPGSPSTASSERRRRGRVRGTRRRHRDPTLNQRSSSACLRKRLRVYFTASPSGQRGYFSLCFCLPL